MMHPRAFYMVALMLLVAGNVGCDDKTKWYVGLQTVLKNCLMESWNNTGQNEFLEKFRSCIQEQILAIFDSFLVDDVIPVFDGLYLVRFQRGRMNSTDNYTESELKDDTNWTEIIFKRLLYVLRTHVFKIDVDYLVNSTSPVNNSETKLDENIFEGRRHRRRRKYGHMVPFMMMGFLLMASILVPMGFQFLAVLGGKALLLAKMALILSSIQGLKKIATNGVNYGLYHTPMDGWHDRSHLETPSHLDLPFPPHIRP